MDAHSSTLVYVPAPILVLSFVYLSAICRLQDLKSSATWVMLPLLNFSLFCFHSLLVSQLKLANSCLSFLVHWLTCILYTKFLVLVPVRHSSVYHSGFIYSHLSSTPCVPCSWGGSSLVKGCCSLECAMLLFVVHLTMLPVTQIYSMKQKGIVNWKQCTRKQPWLNDVLSTFNWSDRGKPLYRWFSYV